MFFLKFRYWGYWRVSSKVTNRYYFAGANTASGYQNYYQSLLQDMEKIFILKGAPGTGKAAVIGKIGDELNKKGYDIDYILSLTDYNPEGLVIPLLNLAIVDGTYPYLIEPRYPGAVEEIINMEECWDIDYLEDKRETIIEAVENYNITRQKAYKYLNTAKELHDKWEQIFLEGLDFKTADLKTEELMDDIFAPKRSPLRHLFASSISFKGPINFFDNITVNCKRRYILKGQPGTGKSTLIKKIAKKALEKGYFVDMYHCSLDPENIDMIVIEQLNIAVIHGTDPHEIKASRPGDVVINMLDCVDSEKAEKYKESTIKLEEEFNITQDQAVKSLKEASEKYNEVCKYYKKAVDINKFAEFENKLINKIKKYINKKEKLF